MVAHLEADPDKGNQGSLVGFKQGHVDQLEGSSLGKIATDALQTTISRRPVETSWKKTAPAMID